MKPFRPLWGPQPAKVLGVLFNSVRHGTPARCRRERSDFTPAASGEFFGEWARLSPTTSSYSPESPRCDDCAGVKSAPRAFARGSSVFRHGHRH